MELSAEQFTERADLWLEAWNEPDAAARETRMRQVWDAGSIFSEPGVTAIGLDALLSYLASLHETASGYQITRTSPVFEDHGHCAFTWQGHFSSGTRIEGTVHGALTPAGRFTILRRTVTRVERGSTQEPSAGTGNDGPRPRGSV